MNRKILIIPGLLLIALLILLAACQTPVNQGLEVTSLEITPLKATPLQRVTIKAEVKNISDREQSYNVPLVVDRLAEDRTIFKLAPGATKTLEFLLHRAELKSYQVTVGNRELTFEVYQPPPPVFKLSDLKVNPAQVDVGEDVIITVKLTNIGGSKGSYTLELKINDAVEKKQTYNLDAGDETNLGFLVSRTTPGTYSVVLADLTGKFVVVQPIIPIEIAPPVVCPPSQIYDKTKKC